MGRAPWCLSRLCLASLCSLAACGRARRASDDLSGVQGTRAGAPAGGSGGASGRQWRWGGAGAATADAGVGGTLGGGTGGGGTAGGGGGTGGGGITGGGGSTGGGGGTGGGTGGSGSGGSTGTGGGATTIACGSVTCNSGDAGMLRRDWRRRPLGVSLRIVHRDRSVHGNGLSLGCSSAANCASGDVCCVSLSGLGAGGGTGASCQSDVWRRWTRGRAGALRIGRASLAPPGRRAQRRRWD